jgi:hypothetical protein
MVYKPFLMVTTTGGEVQAPQAVSNVGSELVKCSAKIEASTALRI